MKFPLISQTDSDREQILAEIFLSKQNKVTKISVGSVLSAFFSAIARLVGMVEKDLAIYMSRLYPDLAFGTYLDDCAEIFGITGRFSASPSNIYLCLFAEPGTIYDTTITFQSLTGISFRLLNNVTIPNSGIAYVIALSTTTGQATNIDPFTITSLSTSPSGHLGVLNEGYAFGGQDNESDLSLRNRIKNAASTVSKDTISGLTQACIKINPLVYKIYNNGVTDSGKIDLRVLTSNGTLLTNNQLLNLQEQIRPHLSLRDVSFFNKSNTSVVFNNIDIYSIDISMQVQFSSSANIELVRRQMQIKINTFIDQYLFKLGTLQWEDVFALCRLIDNVDYIPIESFSWKEDFKIDRPQFPKLRSFILRDLNNNILTNNQSDFNQLYSSYDQTYQSIVLQ